MYRGLSPTILALLPNWAVSCVYYFYIVNDKLIDDVFPVHVTRGGRVFDLDIRGLTEVSA